MPIKINREEALKKYKKFPLYDWGNDKYSSPKIYKSYVLTLYTSSARSNVLKLPTAFVDLVSSLNKTALIFLGESDTPWLNQYNSYPPSKRAYKFLQENGLDKEFNGALKVKLTELALFTKHLFWLTNCNGAFPDTNFLDEQQTITGYICKYGNIHIFTLNKDADELFKKCVELNTLQYLNGTECKALY